MKDHTQMNGNINVDILLANFDFSAPITVKDTKKLILTSKSSNVYHVINHSGEKTNTTDTASEKYVKPNTPKMNLNIEKKIKKKIPKSLFQFVQKFVRSECAIQGLGLSLINLPRVYILMHELFDF